MTSTPAKPVMRPARAHFSSGPCAKRPGWNPENLRSAVLGRSHRSKPAKARLERVLELIREVLEVPDSHRIAIVPASDTGAVEMCLWSMLGCQPVQVVAFDAFGKDWAIDAVEQLRLDEVEVLDAPYGELPDLSRVRTDADVVFTWNGTSAGVRVPDAEFIAADRAGLTICDATSACFAQALVWDKLDVVTFSWQKVLGGEAAHGVLILGPRAVERLETFTPDRPLPKLFRMAKDGRLNAEIFEGATINTPSMLCVEDAIDALSWALSIGGLAEMQGRAERNFAVLRRWVEKTAWVDFLAVDPASRSNTSVCLKVVDPRVAGSPPAVQADFAKRLAATLEKEDVAFDIGGYRDAPPGLRIWCGATVDHADLEALTPWLDWAFAAAVADLPAGRP